MTIGIPLFRDRTELRLDKLLTQPFRRGEPEVPAPASTKIAENA